MKSRYDFMLEGTIRDEVSDNLYPDPLSLNYLDFHILGEYPVPHALEKEEIMSFWNLIEKYYESPELDDVVLTLNGIPHINFLQNGDYIAIPSKTDITSSFTQRGSL